jgi:hypothetical protein
MNVKVVFNKEKMMEERIDVVVGVVGSDDASYDRAFSFFGDLRDIFAQVKQHAIALHSSDEVMEIVENGEGLPQVEFRPRGNNLILNKVVFATRLYESHNFTVVGAQVL